MTDTTYQCDYCNQTFLTKRQFGSHEHCCPERDDRTTKWDTDDA